MSRILKSGKGGPGQSVQPFATRPPSPAAASVPQEPARNDSARPAPTQPSSPGADANGATQQGHAALQAKLRQAEQEAERLGKELEDLSARTETLQNEAFEKGRKEGLQQSGEDSSQRLALLEKGLAAAVRESERKSAEAETLALQVAKVALTRILGDEAHFAQLLPQAIRHQLDRFRNSKPMAVRVSRADFPDADAVAALAAEFPQLRVSVEKDFGPGTCQLSLELGEVEIGLPGQVERLGARLDDMARAGVKAGDTAAAASTKEASA